ncbi:MAG: alpha/beta hydrolase fold domain-containing protein [Actinomycetota bacterium]
MTHVPHPQLADIRALLQDRGLAPADPLSTPLAVARAAAQRYHAVWNEDLPPVDRVVDLVVPGRDAQVPVRLFLPGPARDLPVIVYFHGGGFVLNGVATHERLLRLLALRSGAAVAAVGYRLAPEHRFPAQLHDALAVTAWLHGHGHARGLDAGRIAFAGDSAGANLALSAMLALRDAGRPLPRAGLLAYGMFSTDLDSPSHRALGDGRFGLSTARVDWFWRQYLADPAQRDNPSAVPIAADLAGLPPQLLVAAELDCLLSDSETMAACLTAAGVDAALSVVPGVPHSFLQMTALLEPADRAVTAAAEFLRDRL